MYDLNKLTIEDRDSWHDRPLLDYSVKGAPPNFEKVEVYFRDLEANLIDKIREYKDGFIFGSVAWLTSFPILDALAECTNVQIIVQKEDFLRPDLNAQGGNNWGARLRGKYDRLDFTYFKGYMGQPISSLTAPGPLWIDPIRCVGNHNRDKNPAFPRAHNKFLVFCEWIDDAKGVYIKPLYKPVAVWTGSFNLTANSSNSLENAIYLEDRGGENPVISSFLKEHHQIFCLSEKLDWESDWVAPEFRIGT